MTKHIGDGLQKQTSPQVLQSIASALVGVPYDDLMAAAGCIDVPVSEVVSITVIGINEVGDLSKNEITKVN